MCSEYLNKMYNYNYPGLTKVETKTMNRDSMKRVDTILESKYSGTELDEMKKKFEAARLNASDEEIEFIEGNIFESCVKNTYQDVAQVIATESLEYFEFITKVAE